MANKKEMDSPLRVVSILVLVGAFIIMARLFVLQVMDHSYYTALALDNHEIYQQLYPRRGSILFQDTRVDGKEYPVAVNREYYTLYAVPKDVDKSQVSSTTNFLSVLLQFSDEDKNRLLEKLSKQDDPYEPIAKKLPEAFKEKIDSANIAGIYTTGQDFRYYPEGNLAANILGFTGQNEKGELVGRYGIEGFWDTTLAGKIGFLAGEKGAMGSLISIANRTLQKAEDGADLLLTIDRNVQYRACERLQKGMEEYQAKSAALILMDPKTGAIVAMCSGPDFNPNEYAKVKDSAAFNNTAIYAPYEVGSVFKPVAMSMALDLGLVSPFTTYVDTGERIINDFKIHNALDKIYGLVTMTNVLESSINTGMIWVSEKVGKKRFKEYVDKFGFGKKTGIGLDTELAGDVSNLSKQADIYTAVGSFGQGFSATPLQVVAAYAALASGGKMPRPYIIDEIRHANGQVEKTETQTETVISPSASKLITGMLISVVEKTYARSASMANYYIAAKTGTAQIPGKGGYRTDATNHTFVGFFPATDPKFVLLVKYEEPKQDWAESTAAPVFKDVAKFVLDYYGVPGDKK
jgi:cell division protein FtsI/penicillin-binding protein 2